MRSVLDHYADHLAPVYLWMVGGVDTALAAGEAELDALHLPAQNGDAVLDLGAGFGMHAIPLARRGARVTAVDTSSELLEDLGRLAGDLPVRTINQDLTTFLRNEVNRYAAILCMGDTLTHLSAREHIDELIERAARALLPGGILALTFRDYTQALQDEERFIPVKSDDHRIMVCFLEFHDSTVTVHDILHERRDGLWKMRVSAYRKQRLSPASVTETMRRLDLDVRHESGLGGMVRLIARRTGEFPI